MRIQLQQVAVAGSDYYESSYANYDRQNPRSKLEFYLDLVRHFVPAGGRVFELGTGMGRFLEVACREFECAGVDPNAHGVAVTRDRVPAHVEVAQGTVSDVPDDPAPQAVVAWDVLEHLDDLDGGIATIREKLASGGVLIAVVPVYDGPLGWLVRLLDKDPTHVSKISRHEWLVRLRCGRFDVVETGGILRRLFFGRWYAHITRPQWLLRSMGTAFYFVARKP